MPLNKRAEPLTRALRKRILLLDGASGTMIQDERRTRRRFGDNVSKITLLI